MKTKERLGVKDTLNAAGKTQGSGGWGLLSFTHLLITAPTSAHHLQRSARVQVLTLGHTWPLPPSSCTAFVGSSWCLGATPVPTPLPPHPQISVFDTQGQDSSPAPPTPILLQYFLSHSCALILLCFFPQEKYLNHFGKFPPTHTQHTYVWIGNPICKQSCWELTSLRCWTFHPGPVQVNSRMPTTFCYCCNGSCNYADM